MNVLEARLERRNGGLTAVAGAERINLREDILSTRPALQGYEGRDVILGIRPEDLEDAAIDPDMSEDSCMTGKVVLREALGSEVMVHFEIDARPAVTDETRELARDVGAPEAAGAAGGANESGGMTMVGRFGARSRIREGDTAKMSVDTRSLHFFDPETGLGIYDGAQTKGAGS